MPPSASPVYSCQRRSAATDSLKGDFGLHQVAQDEAATCGAILEQDPAAARLLTRMPNPHISGQGDMMGFRYECGPNRPGDGGLPNPSETRSGQCTWGSACAPWVQMRRNWSQECPYRLPGVTVRDLRHQRFHQKVFLEDLKLID